MTPLEKRAGLEKEQNKQKKYNQPTQQQQMPEALPACWGHLAATGATRGPAAAAGSAGCPPAGRCTAGRSRNRAPGATQEPSTRQAHTRKRTCPLVLFGPDPLQSFCEQKPKPLTTFPKTICWQTLVLEKFCDMTHDFTVLFIGQQNIMLFHMICCAYHLLISQRYGPFFTFPLVKGGGKGIWTDLCRPSPSAKLLGTQRISRCK